MAPAQKLAVAAHMHVLLRRKTGRVTDTEWMADNQDYAREIVRFARVKAEEDGHPDLYEWAGRLETAVLGLGEPGATRAEGQSALDRLRARTAASAPFNPERSGAQKAFQPERTGAQKAFQPERTGAQKAFQPERTGSQKAFAPERTGGFAASVFGHSVQPDVSLDENDAARRDPNAPRYVGGIR
jgi:hypothetical protein